MTASIGHEQVAQVCMANLEGLLQLDNDVPAQERLAGHVVLGMMTIRDIFGNDAVDTLLGQLQQMRAGGQI